MKKRKQIYVKILCPLLKDFKARGVNYCILRNYQFLDNQSDHVGKDFDISISKEDIRKAAKILKKHDFRPGNFNPDKSHKSFLYFSRGEKEDLSLDVHKEGFSFIGIPIISNKKILGNKEWKKFFFFPSKEYEMAIIVLHSILNGNNFKEKYISQIEENFEKIDVKKMNAIFSKIFGEKKSRRIIKNIESKNYGNLLKMRTKLIFKIILKNPLNIFTATNTFLRRRINRSVLVFFRIFNIIRFAPYFAFVGVDGAGKSTACLGAKKFLEENGVSCEIVRMSSYTAKSPLIKILSKIYARKVKVIKTKKLSEITDDILGKTKRPPLYYVFRDILHSTDMLLKYLKILYYRKLGVVVLTDRYVYDIPAYFGINSWRLSFARLFPRPNKTFYLYTNVEKMRKRKPEYILSGLKEIVERYSLISKKMGFKEVETKKIDKTNSKIREEIKRIIIRTSEKSVVPMKKYKLIHSLIK